MVLVLEVVLESDCGVTLVPAIHGIPPSILVMIGQWCVQLSVCERFSKGYPGAIFADGAIAVFVWSKAFPDLLIVRGIVRLIGVVLVIVVLDVWLDLSRYSIHMLNPT